MASNKRFIALALLCPLLLIACGDDGGSGGDGNNGANNGGANNGGGFDPDVPGDKQLKDLDAGEKTAVCEAGGELVNDTLTAEEQVAVQCATAALLAGLFSEDVAMCESTYDACVADPEAFFEDSDFEPTDPDECTLDDVAECTATVDEFGACLEAQIQALDTLASSFDCAEALENAGNPVQPAACGPINTKCPDIFGGGGTNNGGEPTNNGGEPTNNGGEPTNNGGGALEFFGNGHSCEDDQFDIDATVMGEATMVTVTLTLGDESEGHPMTLDTTEDGVQTWRVQLDGASTYSPSQSTTFDCVDSGSFEVNFIAIDADGNTACGGDGC